MEGGNGKAPRRAGEKVSGRRLSLSPKDPRAGGESFPPVFGARWRGWPGGEKYARCYSRSNPCEIRHGAIVNSLTYTGMNVSAGISHQKSNLTAMLKEAALSGRALIVPRLHLIGTHNRGRPLVSQLAEYFDFSQAAVAGVPVVISTSQSREGGVCVSRGENLIGRTEKLMVKDAGGVGLLRVPLEAVYRGFAELPVQLPTHPVLAGIAAGLVPQIPARAAWVHVRRGDVLHRTDAGTSPENIRRILQSVAPATQAV